MKLSARCSLRWPALLGLAWLVLLAPELQAQRLGSGVFVSTPANGSYVHDVPGISGSWYRGSDNPIARLTIELWLRRSDNRFWYGSRWGTVGIPEWLDTWHHSDGSWGMSDPRPGRAQLSDGWYTVDVRQTTTMQYGIFFGFTSDYLWARSHFFVDNTPPSLLTITTPPEGGRQSTANIIRGLAADAPGSSGVERVAVAVRQGDLYWDGAAWTGTAATFNATLNGTAWSLSDRMPGRGQLTLGLTYRIEATAEDHGHNTLSVTNSFLADRDTPELTIGGPTPGDVLDELTSLEGTAIDSDGVVRVEVLLRRVGDGLFWSPLTRNWGAARSVFTLVPNFRGIWRRTQGLPVGAELAEVEYEVLVTAFDQFGYQNSTSSRFTVDKSPPEVATLELPGSLANLNNIAGRLPSRNPEVRRTNNVQMSLQRQSDSAYWDGSKWTARESFLDTRLMGDVWTLRSRMPQPGELGGAGANAGVFNIRTVVTDSFGRRTAGPIDIMRLDVVAPSVTVVAPLFGAGITAPQSEPGFVIEAREPDNDGIKSGVESVVIALTRNNAGVTEYWQWSSAQWGLESFYNPAVPQAGNASRWQHIVPELPPGDYMLFVRATDRAANVGVSSDLFRVSGPPGPVVSIDSPTDGSVIGSTLAISGRTSDASGVIGVYVILSRFSGNTRMTYDWARNDFFVYNDPNIVEVNRQAQGTAAWRIDVPATLELGSYDVSATAVNALNEATQIRSSFQVIDLTPPAVGIWYPENGTPDLTLLAAAGYVRDDQPGARAYVSVMRYRIVSPPEYLDWTNGRWTTEWRETATRRVVIPTAPTPDNPRLSSWDTSLIEVVDDNGNLHEYGNLFQQGNYAVLAAAQDAAGNVSAMALHEFAIADPLPPQVGITTPAAGVIVGTLGTISGTAVDNPGGSGVGRVEIRLFRQSDATYWNGAGWQSTPVFVRAQLGEGTWSYHQGPQGSGLTTGDYYLEAFAYDQTTLNAFAGIAVRADRTPPDTLFITAPAHGSVIMDLPVIRGFIQDDTGGSGPDKVEILVQRDADGQWWDGNVWGTALTTLSTALNGNDWTSTFRPPPRAVLAGGTYTVFAIGYDAAGNRIGVSISLSVPPDTTAPTLTDVSLAEGASVTSLAGLSGNVSDDGRGVLFVVVRIARGSDRWQWNGTQWVSPDEGDAWLETALDNGHWTLTQGPAGANAPAGGYHLTIAAEDYAFNSTAIERNVTLVADTTGPTVYFGEDRSPFPPPPVGPNDVPRLNFTNSQRVAAQFLARLPGVATESFEGLATGSAPTTLTFGANIATLSGTREVFTVLDPTMAPGGGFPTTGTNGLALTSSGVQSFTVTFGSPQAAFGFYGTDIEANQLIVRLVHESGDPSDIPVGVVVPQGSGGVFFFGVIAQDRPFSAVELRSVGPGETFFFDDLTIAAPEQVQPGPDGSWAATQVVLTSTSEAELMVRTGDIDNLGFGWPAGFDPFSGNDTPVHAFPWQPDPLDAIGTDRIMVPSSYNGTTLSDGYTDTTARPDNLPQTIALQYADSLTGITVTAAVLQLFVDDFQSSYWGSQFEVTLNERRAPFLEALINNLRQTGPIGKLITVRIPNEFLSEVASGALALRIDDTTTGAGDGYAVDFVKLLINPLGTGHAGSISGAVQDEAGQGLPGALVSAANVIETTTDEQGHYTLQPVPAGLTVVTISKTGYRTQRFNVNVVANVNSLQNATLVWAPSADTTGPIVTATHPAPDSVVQSLATVAGTVTDPSGVANSVRISIRRDSDQAYWTGTAWVNVGTLQAASLEADRWTHANGPDGADLVPGHYVLSLIATDTFGNETVFTYGESVVAATVTRLGPTPYLSFTDSPFQNLNLEWFYLETFEDGLFNVLGVTSNVVPDTSPAHPRGVIGPLATPTLVTDSVDGDDGVIDGSGLAGHSFFNIPGVIQFSFDATVLGHLPTHAGVVFTDGNHPIALEAFDADGNSLGRITGHHADDSMYGETGEDRFYGVISASGISRIRMSAAVALEVDHLQYGYGVADTVPPVVAFTEPRHQAVVADLTVLRGTASDDRGLSEVAVFIRRNSDQQVWTGTDWSVTAGSFLPATLNPDGSWVYSQGPPRNLLADGEYSLTVLARDRSNNEGVASITVSIQTPVTDTEPPVVTFTQPLDQAVLRDLAEVRGTASDNSSLRDVAVVIQRKGDQQFWNGTAWVPAQTTLPAVLKPDGSWSFASVPAGALLGEGLYTLDAIATDPSGNPGTATITVRIEAPAPPEPPRLTAIEPLGPGKILLRALGTATTTYRVEQSEDLDHWSEIGMATTDSDGKLEFTDSATSGNKGFYRLAFQ